MHSTYIKQTDFPLQEASIKAELCPTNLSFMQIQINQMSEISESQSWLPNMEFFFKGRGKKQIISLL
jgi:roadblock/LC7 domain-containing protein